MTENAQLTLLTPEQTHRLNQAINPGRVLVRDGNAHLEAYDVRAHLTRFFGYGGWDGEVIDSSLLYENRERQRRQEDAPGDEPTGAMRVSVGYRVRYRLTVYAFREREDGSIERTATGIYTEEATGGATNFPDSKRADAHDFAVKTAESQALKRCAINLGDQFGLSLYGRAPQERLVKTVLLGVKYEGQQPAAGEDIDPVVPELSEPQVPEGELEWVEAAAACDSQEAFDRLYNSARAKKVRAATLRAMREATSVAESEGQD